MKYPAPRAIVEVTVRGIPTMAPTQLSQTAQWLREQADYLERERASFGKILTLRYMGSATKRK